MLNTVNNIQNLSSITKYANVGGIGHNCVSSEKPYNVLSYVLNGILSDTLFIVFLDMNHLFYPPMMTTREEIHVSIHNMSTMNPGHGPSLNSAAPCLQIGQ